LSRFGDIAQREKSPTEETGRRYERETHRSFAELIPVNVPCARASVLNYAACIFSGLFGGSQSLTGNPAARVHANTYAGARARAEASQGARKFFNFTAGCALEREREPPAVKEKPPSTIPNWEWNNDGAAEGRGAMILSRDRAITARAHQSE